VQPQEVLQYCAETLRKMGFEVEREGDILFYKGEPLARWVLRVYPISEDLIEGYGAFVVTSEFWEDGVHEIPEEVENAEDIIITDCIASIIQKEVFGSASPVCFNNGEKLYICPSSRLTVEVPIYNSEEMSPSAYRVAVTWLGEKGVEKITEIEPTDFETLRKVAALALL
jgi:hypothetical protein